MAQVLQYGYIKMGVNGRMLKITTRNEVDHKRLEEEKNEIIKEYPPLDWEYEKSVIYGRDNL